MEAEVELPPVFEFVHNIAKKHSSIVNYEREIKHLRYVLDCCEKKCLILERKLKSKKCAKCGHERPNRTTRGTTTRDLTQSLDVGVQFPDLFPQLLAYKEYLKVFRPITPITDPAEVMLISKNAKTCTELSGVTKNISFIDGSNIKDKSIQTDPIDIKDISGFSSILQFMVNKFHYIATNLNKDQLECLQKEIKDEDLTSSNEANVGQMPEKKKRILKKSKQTKKNELTVSLQDKSVPASYIDFMTSQKLRTLDNLKYKNEIEKSDDQQMIIESGLSIEEVNCSDDHGAANDDFGNVNSNILEKCNNMDTANQVESEEDIEVVENSTNTFEKKANPLRQTLKSIFETNMEKTYENEENTRLVVGDCAVTKFENALIENGNSFKETLKSTTGDSYKAALKSTNDMNAKNVSNNETNDNIIRDECAIITRKIIDNSFENVLNPTSNMDIDSVQGHGNREGPLKKALKPKNDTNAKNVSDNETNVNLIRDECAINTRKIIDNSFENVLNPTSNMDIDSVQGHGNREGPVKKAFKPKNDTNAKNVSDNETNDNLIRDECAINTRKIIDNSFENVLNPTSNMDIDSVQGHGNREGPLKTALKPTNDTNAKNVSDNETNDNLIRDECVSNTMKIIDNSSEEVLNPISNVKRPEGQTSSLVVNKFTDTLESASTSKDVCDLFEEALKPIDDVNPLKSGGNIALDKNVLNTPMKIGHSFTKAFTPFYSSHIENVDPESDDSSELIIDECAAKNTHIQKVKRPPLSMDTKNVNYSETSSNSIDVVNNHQNDNICTAKVTEGIEIISNDFKITDGKRKIPINVSEPIIKHRKFSVSPTKRSERLKEKNALSTINIDPASHLNLKTVKKLSSIKNINKNKNYTYIDCDNITSDDVQKNDVTCAVETLAKENRHSFRAEIGANSSLINSRRAKDSANSEIRFPSNTRPLVDYSEEFLCPITLTSNQLQKINSLSVSSTDSPRSPPINQNLSAAHSFQSAKIEVSKRTSFSKEREESNISKMMTYTKVSTKFSLRKITNFPAKLIKTLTFVFTEDENNMPEIMNMFEDAMRSYENDSITQCIITNFVLKTSIDMDAVCKKIHTIAGQIPQQSQVFIRDICQQICSNLFDLNERVKIDEPTQIKLTTLYLNLVEHMEDKQSLVMNFLYNVLFYYSKFSTIVYEILLKYPKLLPSRRTRFIIDEEPVLLVAIHRLMCTRYNMTNQKDKDLLSTLRFFLYFKQWHPDNNYVLDNLMDKLRNGTNCTQLPYAFALFCQFEDHNHTIKKIIEPHFDPMFNEYINTINQHIETKVGFHINSLNNRIAVFLAVYSTVIKKFPLHHNKMETYFNKISLFLKVDDHLIRGAVIKAIIRLRRFDQKKCFLILSEINLTGKEDYDVKNALQSFLLRHTRNEWETIINKPNIY